MSSVLTTVDTFTPARLRERLLLESGVSYGGWMAVHRTIGPEGSRYQGCTCKQGWRCDRPGKHPVFSRFPHGSRDSASLDEVEDWLASPEGVVGRLAAVIAPEIRERVLDADSVPGLATLWRCGEEVMAGWLHVRTPRGLHVWQTDVMAQGHGDRKRVNRILPEVEVRGIDVKVNGFVIWPDGLGRWAVPWDEALDWLATRLGMDGPPGDRLISGPTERQRVRTQERQQMALVASAGLWTDDAAAFHAEAIRWIKDSPVGERNDALNMAGWRCRALIAYADWPVGWLADSLYKAGREVGLTHGETERTVRSGLGIDRGQWESRRYGNG